MAGDPYARQALFSECLPVVVRWCARLGGPRIDAEDAASDVLVIVLRRLGELEQPERFGGWLFGITRRVLSRHRRRAWVKRWTGAEAEDSADPAPGAERTLLTAELTRQVLEVLEQLPKPQREVLVLCSLEDRPASEVATLLEIPIGTVASRLRLARKRFERLAQARKLYELLGEGGVVS